MYKVLLCTQQWPQVTAAGGIARPTWELAKHLAMKGCSVTVLGFRLSRPFNNSDHHEAQEFGIKLLEIQDKSNSSTSPWWLDLQRLVQEKVMLLKPDFVIAQEWQSPLLLSARIDGVQIISWLHGGTMYDHEGNNNYFTSIYDALESELEHYQVINSHAVVSPSHFLLDYYENHGWNLPIKTVSHPYHFPSPVTQSLSKKIDNVINLVFIGQLTIRKGFDLFVELSKSFHSNYPDVKLSIAVYGQSRDFEGDEEVRQLQDFGIKAKYFGTQTPTKMWSEITSHKSIVLCPSRLDNSPNVVYEAICNGVPAVIVGENNGASELSEYSNLVFHFSKIDDVNWDTVLASSDNAEVEIENRLNEIVTEKWLNLFGSMKLPQLEEETKYLTVCVVITSHNRPELLERALMSVLNQDYKVSEIIIVDDASSNFRLIEEVGSRVAPFARIYRNGSSKGPGFSRNFGLRQSTAEVIAFLDDDNTFRRDHISLAISKIGTGGADAVVTYLNIVDSNLRALGKTAVFLGTYLESLSTIHNTLGDTHMVVRRDLFEKFGGFSETWPSSQEDWGLMLRWQRAGVKIATTGEPTINYRVNMDGIQQSKTTFSSWSEIDIYAPEGLSWIASYGFRNAIMFPGNNFKQMSALKLGLKLLRHRNFKLIKSGIKLVLRNPSIIRRKFSNKF